MHNFAPNLSLTRVLQGGGVDQQEMINLHVYRKYKMSTCFYEKRSSLGSCTLPPRGGATVTARESSVCRSGVGHGNWVGSCWLKS